MRPGQGAGIVASVEPGVPVECGLLPRCVPVGVVSMICWADNLRRKETENTNLRLLFLRVEFSANSRARWCGDPSTRKPGVRGGPEEGPPRNA